MKIKFSSIKIENFKNIGMLETFFGEKTFIYGANETGKTSFADAISWCLTGKNSMGDSQFGFVPVGKDFLSPSVTLKMDIDVGKKDYIDHVILQRVYQAKQNKNKEFIGEYQTICYINRLKVGVKEFDKWIETHICDSEIFRLIHDIRYFAENIGANRGERPWEAQRRLLFSISGIKSDIDFARVKKKFAPIFEGLQQYDNANQYMGFLKSEEKRLNENIRYNNSQTEMMRSMLVKSEAGDNIEEDIDQLNIEKDNIENKIEQERKKQEREKKERIESAQKQFDEKIKEFRNLQTEYSRKVSELSNKRKELLEETTNLHCSLVSTRFNLKKAQEGYDNVLVQCPTCGQYISQEIVESEKSKLKEQIEILQAALDSMAEEELKACQELKLVEEDISKLVAPVYPEELRKLQDEIFQEAERKINIESKLSDKLKEIKDRISELLTKKQIGLNNKRLKTEITEIELRTKDMLQQKADNSRLMDLLYEFIDAKCKYAEKKVNDLFDGIEFKLFQKNKTNDELKDCCNIFWHGVPYDSLSYSTKFVVSMNIVFAFQKFYKVEMPIVVDNAESIDFCMDIPVQSILLVKREENCECGEETGRKESDGLWTCKGCGNRFKKNLEIEFE